MSIITFPVSDHPLASRVRLSLQGHDPRLDGILVEVTGAEFVHLSGQANSFYLRQLAVSIARHIPGVRQVSDGIQVTTSPPAGKPR